MELTCPLFSPLFRSRLPIGAFDSSARSLLLVVTVDCIGLSFLPSRPLLTVCEGCPKMNTTTVVAFLAFFLACLVSTTSSLSKGDAVNVNFASTGTASDSPYEV